jgi:hypothetical protein
MGFTMTTTDDGFGEAEQATAEVRHVVPAIVERIGAPMRGVFTKPAPRRAYLVEQVVRFTDDDGDTKRTETRGVIGRGQLHILAGEGGAGKGRWLLTIAAALAASDAPHPKDPDVLWEPGADGGMDNVCGLRVNGIPEDEKVLLLLGEDDAIDFHQRCEGVAEALGFKDKRREDRFMDRLRWGSAHGLSFTIVDAKKVHGGVEVHASKDFNSLVGWVKENGPWAFIAMDPMARFAGVEENDNALQTKVYGLVETLTEVNGEGKAKPAVLVVDHTAKPAKGNEKEAPSQHWIRGAGAKVNAARVAMIMVPGGGDEARVDSEGRSVGEAGFDEGSGLATAYAGDVVWHVVKNNGQQKAEPVSLSFTKHGGLLVETAEQARARRKRQWHAANDRGDVKPPKAVGPTVTTRKGHGNGATASVDFGDDT